MTQHLNIEKYDTGDIMIESKKAQWQRMMLSNEEQDDLLNYLLIKRRKNYE
jgi:hypothetical protein